MAEFSKGDRVHIKGDLFTRYMRLEKDEGIPPMWLEGEVTCLHRPSGKGRIRCLFRKPTNVDGIVCGYSYVATGHHDYGGYDEPSSLTEDKRHTVVIVQPMNSNGSTRYLKPLTCREEDLEIIPQDHNHELSASKVLNNALLAKLDRVQAMLKANPLEYPDDRWQRGYNSALLAVAEAMDLPEHPQYSHVLSGLIHNALYTDGAHHKQWYIEQIAGHLGIDLELVDRALAQNGHTREPGIAP